MPLTPGTRIGPYEIHSALGAGGMGEVYRARDTKLGRDVALKLLPGQFAADPERLARFEREAQVLASLSHAHIAQIYGIEESPAGPALAMELIAGQTLADRIAGGAMPVVDALTLARQMAEALEAAHDKGIIHRDLKPANVMITDSGDVKVLDFGLAAVSQPAGASSIDVTNSPTLTMGATRAGVILGTAAYMSPEQAAGKAVDRRADIWSFGVIVWEMLAGRRLFDGETISHTLADVLRAEIDLAHLPRETPPAIREMLRRCLDRDARSRLRDIGEARIAIQKSLDNPSAASVATAPAGVGIGSSRLTTVAWAVAIVSLAAAASMAFVYFRERASIADPIRFQLLPPERSAFRTTAVLSPDGRKVVFDAPGHDGRPVLWVRPLDSLEARTLPGTEGVSPGPFWSPDSRMIAFGVNGFPSRLKKVEASGGAPQTVSEFNGTYRGGSWSHASVMLFAAADGVRRLSDTGGTSAMVTKMDIQRDVQHHGPVFLPDDRHFLYYRAGRMPENRGIYLGSIDLAPEQQSDTRLIAADSDPIFVPSATGTGGFVLFLHEASLVAQPFDGRSTFTGETMPIAENVGAAGTYGWFSASQTGALAFRSGSPTDAVTALTWVDRHGKKVGQVGAVTAEGGTLVQLAPDGKRVVVTRPDRATVGLGGLAQGGKVWTADLTRGVFSRLTASDATENSPAVGPAGRVVFSSTLNGAVGDLYWMSASGIGAPEPLLIRSPTVKHPNGVSADGRYLIFDDHTPQQQDLWILPLDAPPGGERKPIPFLVTPADETFGQFSPDGKWIAYSSDESGRRDVYVQGFAPDRVPAVAVGKWQISSAGGDKPRWSRDGKEIYYVAPDRKLMAVPVRSGASFEPGVAVPLFDTQILGFMPYDVAPDGRFLLNALSDVATEAATPVTIVLNWQNRPKK